MGVLIDGIVTDFVAVMERIGKLTEADQDTFCDGFEAIATDNEELAQGMEVISCYFSDASDE